jgi:hypothetical protein
MTDQKIEVYDNLDKKMDLIEQTHTKSGVIKLKFKNKTNLAMVLLRQNGTYDEFLYNLDGEMIRYKNKKLE